MDSHILCAMVTATLVLNLGQINSESERGFSCRLTMLNVSTVWSHWRLQSGSSGDIALSTHEWALSFCQRSRGWNRNTPWGKVRLLTTSPQGTCSLQGEYFLHAACGTDAVGAISMCAWYPFIANVYMLNICRLADLIGIFHESGFWIAQGFQTGKNEGGIWKGNQYKVGFQKARTSAHLPLLRCSWRYPPKKMAVDKLFID